MVLDTMTLEELIREIKTDFSEVKGRWKNYVRKFRKTAQKRTMFPWLWEANIKTRRFNEWYISFYAESKKEVGILNPTFTMLFKYKGQLLVGAVTNDVVLIFTGHFFDRYKERFFKIHKDSRPVTNREIMKVFFLFNSNYCFYSKEKEENVRGYCYDGMLLYRRNYIEGLFLSSGVVRNPDYTMERLVRVAKDLRLIHRFNGYIHLKSIPGASRELVNEAGLYADRLSVNIEIPKEENLKLLAPEKDHQSVYRPMHYIQQGVLTNKEDRKKFRHTPRFAPAGQSTQMIVGATSESDKDILYLSSSLYRHPTMRRVYYSGYISVNTYDKRLPALKQPPLVRENRLYQADWLLRFYQFKVEEIVDDSYPDLDLEIDPKLGWALRHPEQFPVDINRADYEMVLRVPGIGVKSARFIVASRRFSKLGFYELKKIGVVMKKAQYFITCNELPTRTVN